MSRYRSSALRGGGSIDAFVVKLSRDDAAVEWSTYLGGSGDDWASDIALDGRSGVWLTGATGSANFPVVNAREVPAWQHWQVIVMTQRLISAGWMRVVIRMSRQVQEHQIAVGVIAVPRVMRFTALKSAARISSPQQTVVLDVVGTR